MLEMLAYAEVKAPKTKSQGHWKEAQATRRENPGVLVLFSVNDWWEAYGDDAKTVSEIARTTIVTRRDPKSKAVVEMTGFPKSRLESVLPLLRAAGHRVKGCVTDWYSDGR